MKKMPTKENVLALLRSGTGSDRIDFLQSLPPNGFSSVAAGLVSSENPGMVLVAFGPVIQEYCNGSNPELGAVLAAAAHERAIEIWQTVPGHGLLPTTLSTLACSHVKALALLGRSEEVLTATDAYIPLYEKLGEPENLPSLRVLRIEALVNLKVIDEAWAALQDENLLHHPIQGMEARRLKGIVDRIRGTVTGLKADQPANPQTASSEELLGVLKTAIGLGFEGKEAEKLMDAVNQIDPQNRLDPNDPEGFNRMNEILEQGEGFLAKGGGNSELAIRGRVRKASQIFVHGTPAREVILESLAELTACLAWGRKHTVTEIINDSLWGMYLCHSRLQQPSEAADALIALRTSLESLREGIEDPLQRGGVFSGYKYLFNAMCENLYQAGRAEDLLEAIESSKGRAIADRLTAQAAAGEVVADSAIYAAVATLPDLTGKYNFNYLTFFVDEACVYAALVDKKGTVRAIPAVTMNEDELRLTAGRVDPNLWEGGAADVSRKLSPLVSWLDQLLEQGIVEKGDHICYSADDEFNNVPLHYLHFRDGLILDWFSVSKVHTAFHLSRVLGQDLTGPLQEYAAFVVPGLQDLDKDNADEFVANLNAPWKWLRKQGLKGHAVRMARATLEGLATEALDHRIVHFATHGYFPEDKGNPFHDSYLLISDRNGLPDKKRHPAKADRLSPEAILELGLNLEGSHVTTMACVSGLAREGIGGDNLGLDWAFIQAGASSLISTHWSVRASCSAQFFTRFYEKWIIHKQSRAVAFREAMLELLQGDHSPASLRMWTAFSLTGDFR
jgi:CHAT domain-containing protein